MVSDPESSKHSDSETEDQCPNKVDMLKEMFPQIESAKLTCLLCILNGNVQKVITLCLEGLTTAKLLRVFKHVKMSTRIRKVAVDVDHILHDALNLQNSMLGDRLKLNLWVVKRWTLAAQEDKFLTL